MINLCDGWSQTQYHGLVLSLQPHSVAYFYLSNFDTSLATRCLTLLYMSYYFCIVLRSEGEMYRHTLKQDHLSSGNKYDQPYCRKVTIIDRGYCLLQLCILSASMQHRHLSALPQPIKPLQQHLQVHRLHLHCYESVISVKGVR